jgi:hypothetical protein
MGGFFSPSTGGAVPPSPLSMPTSMDFLLSLYQIEGSSQDAAIVETSGGGTATIGYGADRFIDKAALDAYGAVIGFRKVFDHSGNTFDVENTTYANQAKYDPDDLRRGMPALKFRGVQSQEYSIPSGLEIDRRNCTIVIIHAPQFCNTLQSSIQLGTGTSNRLSLDPESGGSGGVGGAIVRNATTASRLGICHPTQPCVEIFRSSDAGQNTRINGRQSDTLAAASSVTMAGGFIGRRAVASGNVPYYTGDAWLYGVKAGVWTDEQCAAFEAQVYALMEVWNNPTAFTLLPGDSLRAGEGGDGVTTSELLEAYFAPGQQVEMRNIGISGQSVATMVTQLENDLLSAYRRDLPINLLDGRGGNNDIQSLTDPATIYTNITLMRDTAAMIGYDEIYWENLQARLFANPDSATKQTNQGTLNTSINGNAANFTKVIDLRTTFNDETDTSKYDPDQIHFNRPGYGIAAGLMWDQAIEDGLTVTPYVVPALTANPLAIGDVRMFLDTNDDSLTNVVTNRVNRITSHLDKSGNNYTATPYSATTRPGFYRKGLNGRPAMSFRGGQGLRLNDSLLTLLGNGANTIIFVYKAFCTGDSVQNLIYGYTSGAGPRWGITISATEMTFQNRNSSSSATTYTRNWDTNTHIVAMRRTGTTVELIHDGVQVASASNGENTSLAGGIFIMGANNNVGGNRFHGLMSLPISHSKYLSNAELNTLGGAMATDFGAGWTGL